MTKVAIILLILAAVYGLEGAAVPNDPNIFPINANSFSPASLMQGMSNIQDMASKAGFGPNMNGAAISTVVDSAGKKMTKLLISENGKISTMDFNK
ncbi:hypothetical protein F0U44_22520 [Nocardioides humilatus]|uniref:Uncharacterized protein n=2 Tax=Actinomycetes TaxID=1760 RepID=A0A5B1KYB6_9ACTN|nr:hypothetical protein F0U44_22520 [Nocardioides humilatus]KAA2241276.1 hypothetical protein F0L68_41445 [Solihabitans fulvus]